MEGMKLLPETSIRKIRIYESDLTYFFFFLEFIENEHFTRIIERYLERAITPHF